MYQNYCYLGANDQFLSLSSAIMLKINNAIGKEVLILTNLVKIVFWAMINT